MPPLQSLRTPLLHIKQAIPLHRSALHTTAVRSLRMSITPPTPNPSKRYPHPIRHSIELDLENVTEVPARPKILPLDPPELVTVFLTICKPLTPSFRILLLKRNPNTHPYPSHWSAVTGKLEPSDTSPSAGATRELEEETRILFDKISYLTDPIIEIVKDEKLGKEWKVHVFFYQLMETMEKSCTELENEINLWKGKEWEGPWIDLEEGVNDEYRWVKLEDLMSGEIEGAKIVDGLGGSMMRMLKMWEDTGGPEDWDDWWV